MSSTKLQQKCERRPLSIETLALQKYITLQLTGHPNFSNELKIERTRQLHGASIAIF